jgi:hypothetical protein
LIREFAVLKDAVFAVAARTSVRAVQMHEILARFPAPISTISVNLLRKQEREAFSKLVSKSGLLIPRFKRKVCSGK